MFLRPSGCYSRLPRDKVSTSGLIMKCLVCSQTLAIDFTLENIPSQAQGFSKNKNHSLKKQLTMQLSQCSGCGLVQYVGPTVPYFQKAIRSNKLSESLTKFRLVQFQNFLNMSSEPIKSVFELGAGQGEHLDIFKRLGVNTAGVEGDAGSCELCLRKGHRVSHGFLGPPSNTQFDKMVKFDALLSFNFIEHLPKPRNTLTQLSQLLIDGSLALFEVPNFDMIIRHHLFNEFIPDHRCYFTKNTFRCLLSISGFEVVSMDEIWDGYVLSAIAKKRVANHWSDMSRSRSKMRDQIQRFFGQTDRFENAIWSAGHQSLTTISNLELANRVSCIIDSSEAKQGTFAPASGLPVVHPDVLKLGKIKRILVMAAGFNKEIIKKLNTEFSSEISIATLDKGMVINAKK